MTDAQIKQLKKALKEQNKKIKSSKEYALKFLQDSGLLTKKGNVRKAS